MRDICAEQTVLRPQDKTLNQLGCIDCVRNLMTTTGLRAPGDQNRWRNREKIDEKYRWWVPSLVQFPSLFETCAVDSLFMSLVNCTVDDYFCSWVCLVKVKAGLVIAVNGTPSHSCGVSLAVRDHTVLPVTRHKWTHPALTPARHAGTRFTYSRGMEVWVDQLGELLHTEMV